MGVGAELGTYLPLSFKTRIEQEMHPPCPQVLSAKHSYSTGHQSRLVATDGELAESTVAVM